MMRRLWRADREADGTVRSRLSSLCSGKTSEENASTEPEVQAVQVEPTGRFGSLVERWLPACMHLKAVSGALVFAGVAAIAAIAAAVGVWTARPTVEQPPAPVVHTLAASSAVAPSEVTVSVAGKVGHPGLITVPSGSRVADAIRAAGGALPGTDLSTVNLARKLSDGEQVSIGIPAVDSAPDQAGNPTEKVDLNTATLAQLQTLPGVGPAIAQRILQWRSRHGRFESVDQLHQVDGVGDAKFVQIKDLVHT